MGKIEEQGGFFVYLLLINFFGWCSFGGKHYDRKILTEWEVGGIGAHDIIFPKNY